MHYNNRQSVLFWTSAPCCRFTPWAGKQLRIISGLSMSVNLNFILDGQDYYFWTERAKKGPIQAKIELKNEKQLFLSNKFKISVKLAIASARIYNTAKHTHTPYPFLFPRPSLLASSLHLVPCSILSFSYIFLPCCSLPFFSPAVPSHSSSLRSLLILFSFNFLSFFPPAVLFLFFLLEFHLILFSFNFLSFFSPAIPLFILSSSLLSFNSPANPSDILVSPLLFFSPVAPSRCSLRPFSCAFLFCIFLLFSSPLYTEDSWILLLPGLALLSTCADLARLLLALPNIGQLYASRQNTSVSKYSKNSTPLRFEKGNDCRHDLKVFFIKSSRGSFTAAIDWQQENHPKEATSAHGLAGASKARRSTRWKQTSRTGTTSNIPHRQKMT